MEAFHRLLAFKAALGDRQERGKLFQVPADGKGRRQLHGRERGTRKGRR